MKKVYMAMAITAAVFCSCAAPQEKTMTEEYWTFSRTVLFTPENLISENSQIRAKALADYTALEDDSKKQVITYLAYMLADEKDALKRHEILDLLRDIKAGPYVVAPLIRAYGSAKFPGVRTEISQFINEYKPSTLEPAALISLFDDKNLETKIKAIRVLAAMKSKAGPALPEIIKLMHQTGPSYGLYAECFDYGAQISKGAMLAAAALDIGSRDRNIRESALRKIYEVYKNEKSTNAERDDSFKAIIRIIYTGDEEFSGLAKKMLEDSGFQETRLKIAEYDAYKNMKVESMKALTEANLKKKFAGEEDDLYMTLKLYYIEHGRKDAVNSIVDPVKEGQNP
jgi:HEAT repeat protein